MYGIVLTFHVAVCVLLILIVLLQVGKAGMSGLFGGGSNDAVFSTAGGNTLLRKITAFCAIGFMITSLTLSVFSSKKTRRSLAELIPPAPVIPTDVVDQAKQKSGAQESKTPVENKTNK